MKVGDRSINMNSTDVVLEDAIVDAVRRWFKHREANRLAKPFVPGETPVPPSGKIIGDADYLCAIDAVLDGWFTDAHWVDKFEQKFLERVPRRWASMCNSGSSANLLALTALCQPDLDEHLRPGDKVVTAACGFPTTISPIPFNKLVPVFVDVELETLVPSFEQIKNAIESSGARAVMLAHTLGNPWPIDQMSYYSEDKVWVVEDNCDSLGSYLTDFKSRYTGTFGDLATHSFYPAHHMTTGEGGMVVGDSPQLKKIVESLRDWGRDCWCDTGVDNTCGKRFGHEFADLPDGYDHKYVYSRLGFNLKAGEVAAALGVAQLDKYSTLQSVRKNNHERLLTGLKETKVWEHLMTAEPIPGASPSWFGMPLIVRDGAPFSRAKLVAYLNEKKIGTRPVFAGNFMSQPAMNQIKDFRHVGEMKNTQKIMHDGFWIGVWPGLTHEMIDYVIEMFSEFTGRG